MTGIYLITNKIDGKQYVGQSVNIEKRWKDHIREVNGKSQCHIYRAMRKYGIENFSFEVLEECPVEKLDEREIYWISELDTYKNGYNMTIGGEGGNKGRNSYSEEYKKQYYQDHKEERKQYNQEHKEEIREQRKQYREEHKDEIGQYLKTHKDELRDYKKQYYQDHKEEYKQYYKQYYQDHKEEKKQFQRQYRASKKSKTMKIHIEIEIPLW